MKTAFIFLFTTLLSALLWAQEKGADVGTQENSNWYPSPWLCIVVAAVVVLLIAALAEKRRAE